ncbi:unnamed protein product [Gongylonema pulchrum]|uniref:Uncharacterized protein n=1 Tax=Gongylonema pulchrum TaxID=637853 RepID=A0A183DZZ1_9BILA|nr:unnamed protein product [Gongylonema pulchrum]
MVFLRRWGSAFVDYWKMVGNDYVTVLKDLAFTAKKKPASAAIKLAALGLEMKKQSSPSWSSVIWLTSSLPLKNKFCTENGLSRDMLNGLVERRHQMVLVPNSIHSERADEAISSRTMYLDQNRLKLVNCILFSILVKLPDGDNVCLYENRDRNLKRWWWQRFDEVVDIVVFGRWILLRKSFENYDICTNEHFPDECLNQYLR